MALKIFEALNNIQGKRGRFGYTLTSTVDVMNSLQAAQMQFEGLQGGGGRLQGGTGGDFLSIGSNGGGDLVSNALSGYFDSEGFVNNGYLAQVSVHGYGAFVVTKRTDDGEKSAVVPVEIGNDEMQDGIDCDCTPRFLANVNNDFKQYKEKSFVYGFAIDVANFGVPFFNKYYPTLNLDNNKLSWLMYERCLCATIKFNNKEITGLVTVDYHQGEGGGRNVYIPFILLMQEDIDVSVNVKIDDKVVPVDGGDVSNPFSLLIYDMDTGEVSFGAEDVQSLVQNSNLAVSYGGCSLTSGPSPTYASIRLFLNYEKKATAEEIMALTIPEEIEDRLFNQVDESIIPNGSLSGSGDLSAACSKLSERLHDNLSWFLVQKAEAQVAHFESGGRWDSWTRQDCSEGASIGRHQMSSKAGNVYDYLITYQSLGGQVSPGFMREATAARQIGLNASARGSYSSAYVDGSKMLPYKQEFRQQSLTDIGKNAQLMVYFEGIKGNFVVKWYNELQCSTALELSSIMGAVNHWPYGMDVVYGHYKDDILKAKTINEKAELIERCHMAANYVRKWKSRNYNGLDLKSLNPSWSRLALWRGRHTKMLNWARGGLVNNW